MAEPLISVVMPCCEAEATIGEAAASVLGQSWRRVELIVASDDGRDYRRFLAERCGVDDARIVHACTGGVRTGDGNARNAGLAAATGDLVTLLDADDAYAPGRLEAMAEYALADGAALDDTQLLIGERVAASLLHDDERGAAPVPATAERILRDRIPVFPMWRRRDFDLRWRRLPHAADVIFNLELLSAAPAMRIAPLPGYLYRKRPGSMTLSADMTQRSRAAYFEIIRAIAAGEYALAPHVADLALYEIAKNLNQAAPFAAALAADPAATHELLAIDFNGRRMTEAERYACFAGAGP